MAKAYLSFTKTGTFKYTGKVRVDVDSPAKMKDIWAAAHDQMFREYLVQGREYDNEVFSFELIEVIEPEPAPDTNLKDDTVA